MEIKASEAEKIIKRRSSIPGNDESYDMIDTAYDKAIEALKLLEKQENGLLVELPCKVGDTVYKVNKASRKVAEHNIIKIEYESNDDKGFCCQIWFENYDFCFVHHFGKTVFLTSEEAEKALDQQQPE